MHQSKLIAFSITSIFVWPRKEVRGLVIISPDVFSTSFGAPKIAAIKNVETSQGKA
jgi:hypothetical protein